MTIRIHRFFVCIASTATYSDSLKMDIEDALRRLGAVEVRKYGAPTGPDEGFLMPGLPTATGAGGGGRT